MSDTYSIFLDRPDTGPMSQSLNFYSSDMLQNDTLLPLPIGEQSHTISQFPVGPSDGYGLEPHQVPPAPDLTTRYSYYSTEEDNEPQLATTLLSNPNDTFARLPMNLHYDNNPNKLQECMLDSMAQHHEEGMPLPVPLYVAQDAVGEVQRQFQHLNTHHPMVHMEYLPWPAYQSDTNISTSASHIEHMSAVRGKIPMASFDLQPNVLPKFEVPHYRTDFRGEYSHTVNEPITCHSPFGAYGTHEHVCSVDGQFFKSEESTAVSSARQLPAQEHLLKTPRRRPVKKETKTVSHGISTASKSDSKGGMSPKTSFASLKSTKGSNKQASTKNDTTTNTQAKGVGSSAHQVYKIVRGITAGGAITRPSKQEPEIGNKYVPAELIIHGALMDELCHLLWNQAERADRRRIIRLERVQVGQKVHALFLIVGLALIHPKATPPPPGVDVVEFSCLECHSSEVDFEYENTSDRNYYITSVEVIGIIEVLIGIRDMDSMLRRKERGRIRSNLMPFWLKKPVSSKKNSSHKLVDPRMEFARRIMAYKIRKPRGFDKDVRILQWNRLVPALQRALQCYYVEVPDNEVTA